MHGMGNSGSGFHTIYSSIEAVDQWAARIISGITRPHRIDKYTLHPAQISDLGLDIGEVCSRERTNLDARALSARRQSE